MRVVHVITGLQQGGAENALYRLLQQEPQPAQVRVVSLTEGGSIQSRLEAMGIEVICLKMRCEASLLVRWWRLVRLLREWKPEIVQTWMYHADLLGGLAGKLAGIPVCWGIRNGDLSPNYSKRSTRCVARICGWLSGWIPSRAISCSKRAVLTHAKLGYVTPFVVVPNGVDIDAWAPRPEHRMTVRAELGIAEEAFVFAHAGRADPQKDHTSLAVAFSHIRSIRQDARLVMCGKGLAPGDGYFEELPFTRGARTSVIALGARDDLQRLWQAADVFVLSSIGEAFPNVLAEAMACGVPCVTTDVGDAAEIVGDTGIIVVSKSAEELASAMLAMIQMPVAERRMLALAARKRVSEFFTLERMGAGFRHAWHDVLTGDASQCVD